MKVSTRTVHGLRAMLYLADHYGQGSVPAAQIAGQEGISRPFLEQILHLLKKRHWIKSVRGPAGGYILVKRPAEIRLLPLLRDLEGDLLEVPEKGQVKSKGKSVGTAAGLYFWQRWRQANLDSLEKISLKQLLDGALDAKTGPKSHPIDFNI